MPMSDLRIFSYLPNPRIWKATIAARLCGVDLEIRGAKPAELKDWLWDFDARPLSPADRGKAKARAGRVGFKGGLLAKTDSFLAAHPFATVPAAFSPDGAIGIFESDSNLPRLARAQRWARDCRGTAPCWASGPALPPAGQAGQGLGAPGQGQGCRAILGQSGCRHKRPTRRMFQSPRSER
jgi:hypothetical protein